MYRHIVFFLSDHTGITVEKLGHSLLSQFEDLRFIRMRIPYINSTDKAQDTHDKISAVYRKTGEKPIVISSIIDKDLKQIIQQCDCIFFDFFDAFIPAMEQALGESATLIKGRTHSMHDQEIYHSRIDAVNYTLANDDGANIKHYDEADIILIGVSRSGKTPTCLYLALQFGINAANYPLVEPDLESLELPKPLQKYKNKVFGLTIDANRLQKIRQERLPDSRYAATQQCRNEIAASEELYLLRKIPFINTATISIEEIATTIMDRMTLLRRKI